MLHNLKHVIKTYPETILLAMVASLWLGERSFNPALVSVIVSLVLILITRNRFVAITIGFILLMLSGFMMLAVFSEFAKFKTVNKDTVLLLTFGTCIFASTGLLSLSLIHKYLPKPAASPDSAASLK